MIEISKIIRSKRRSIALIVERDGSLVVRAPLQASDETIRRLVESKADWIRLTQEKARKLGPAPVRKKFVAGEEFWYLGQRYPLEFVKGRQTALYLDGSFKMSPATRPQARLAFENWYKKQAKAHITAARQRAGSAARVCVPADPHHLGAHTLGVVQHARHAQLHLAAGDGA